MASKDNELILPMLEEENPCLPLSINVVSRYWNVELPLFEAEETAKKYPAGSGSVIIEGIELAERHGLGCKIFDSSLDELKKILDAGIPPIVILPGIGDITQHASIISGYDNDEKKIIHYVPKSSDEGMFQGAIPDELFEKKWSQEGNIAIIIGSPETMSSLNLDNDSQEKSFRQCFNSEREMMLKNSEKAKEFLNEAISLCPSNSTAYLLLAGLLNEQNSSECQTFYKKCLELNGNCYLAYKGLGNYFLKQQKFEESEKNYSKAIEIDAERSGSIYKNRAYVREKQQKNSQAKDDLKNYLKFSPKAKDRGTIEQAIREL